MTNSSFKLDWDFGPAWTTHRRVYLCIILSCMASLAAWQALFPNVFWFAKAWTALATGASIGVGIGYCWQLVDPKRRPQSSGWFLLLGVLGWGAFGIYSIFVLGPDFASQEAELARIRSLEYADIEWVRVVDDARRSKLSKNKAAMAGFRTIAKNATLFYPGKEGSVEEFDLSIVLRKGGVLSYKARVPERHPHDFSIEFRGSSTWCDVLFPQGALWLENYFK